MYHNKCSMVGRNYKYTCQHPHVAYKHVLETAHSSRLLLAH